MRTEVLFTQEDRKFNRNCVDLNEVGILIADEVLWDGGRRFTAMGKIGEKDAEVYVLISAESAECIRAKKRIMAIHASDFLYAEWVDMEVFVEEVS